MNCSKCGKTLDDAFVFCPFCGGSMKTQGDADIDSVITENVANVEEVTFEIAGRALAFGSNVIAYNSLHKRFIEKAQIIKADFVKYYSASTHTYERLFAQDIPKFLESVSLAVRFGVSILVEYGIMDVDFDYLCEFAADDINVMRTLGPIKDKVDEIEQFAIERGYKRNLSRMNRSEWVGGGFGLAGAIKGAVQAELLNAGTNLFRGLKDTVVNAADCAEITRMQNDLANSNRTTFYMTEGLFYCCESVFYAVWRILLEDELVEPVTFYSKSSQRRNKNILTLFSNGRIPYDEAIDELCNSIQDAPKAHSLYVDLYKVLTGSHQKIADLAEYFGIWTYKDNIAKVDSERLESIRKLPEDSIRALDSKISKLAKLLSDYPEIQQDIYLKTLRDKRDSLKKQEERIRVKREEAASTSESISQARMLVDRAYQHDKLSIIWNAAQKGDVYAEYKLESHYRKLCKHAFLYNDINEMRKLTSDVQNRADKGEVFALYLMCLLIYEMAVTDRRNPKSAEEMAASIIKIAKSTGIISAIYTVGFWGANEKYHATQSIEEGKKLIIQAVDKMHPLALLSWGLAYRHGKYGLQKDDKKAEYYLDLASQWDVEVARKELEKLRRERSGQTSGGCFITSAVCKTLGHDDDCFELTMFRHFRDNWLITQPDGKSLISEYYTIAPQIVTRIDSLEESNAIYHAIWDNYLSPCLKYLLNGNNENCKKLYKDMVLTLQNEYCSSRGG